MRIVDRRKIRSLDQASPLIRRPLFPVLYPISLIYGVLPWVCRRLPVGEDVGIPVVSVGSVFAGGTGKTPLCMLVAERLVSLGRKVCVLSRGYRRKSKVSPMVVSDGASVLVSVADAGDEPYLMAKRLAGVPVVVDRNRARAAQAAARFRPDVCVLDDGFQTRSILKHLELVCIEAASLATRQSLLPAGRLREGWGAIKPGHVVVIVLEPGVPRPDTGSLERFGTSRILFASRESEGIYDFAGRPVCLDSSTGGRFLVLTGIARPSGFEEVCRRLGLDTVISLRMDDHHWYNDRDVERIVSLMRQHGCTRIVTTEKDFHRLPEALRKETLMVRDRLRMDDPEALSKILEQAVSVR